MECLFCNIVSGDPPSFKVWEDENFIAFLDIMPVNPGHILLIPKSHTEEVFDLSNDLYDGIFRVMKKLAEPLKRATSAKRIGVAIEGLEVPHVHIHLVPIYNNNELNPLRARSASAEDLIKMQGILRGVFIDSLLP